ncbi:MAG: anthranilate phosphoribosyltransferase family protein [Kaiparowitsia implicata GSE-PSE-MK54-09C]|jgi:anthranilate phosphoribosyltransferase|nr:anthranilate phosphoribosyltransferase family protein [Kaiparowitsia implicata GSE-PSE-MK54-09C]
MSNAFRELLRKVGSGTHTSQSLTRGEAAAATRMMLLQEATPAQIGAFMIAHRIRRPTGVELAGMLDAYQELGPALQTVQSAYPITVFGHPYDGRDRTMPLGVLTALILASLQCPVVMHGGDRMPTKEGLPLVAVWQSLGVHWAGLGWADIQHVFETCHVGFCYLPQHFPSAQGLVPYREQIGKRPPFATLELFWSPYGGAAQVIVGYVHPPTEGMVRTAFALHQQQQFITVKGVEGSCDLPRERTAIIGVCQGDQLERFHLHPAEFGMAGKNVAMPSLAALEPLMRSVLHNEPSELRQSVIWNAGFYLWRCGVADSLEGAIALAAHQLEHGLALQALHTLQAQVEAASLIRR